MSKLPAGLWMTAAPAELVKTEAASRRVRAASAQAESRVDRANRGFAFFTRPLPIWFPNQLLWETEPSPGSSPFGPNPAVALSPPQATPVTQSAVTTAKFPSREIETHPASAVNGEGRMTCVGSSRAVHP